MKKPILFAIFIFSLLALRANVLAQEMCKQHKSTKTTEAKPQSQSCSMADMPGMDHGAHEPISFIDEILHHSTAGTSAQPNSTAEPMVMLPKGNWMFMFHGEAFINDIQQSGPRGDD